MLTLFEQEPREMSLEERILAMSEETIRTRVPVRLRETGLFTEDEIDRAVCWLLEFRRQHHLDVIE